MEFGLQADLNFFEPKQHLHVHVHLSIKRDNYFDVHSTNLIDIIFFLFIIHDGH